MGRVARSLVGFGWYLVAMGILLIGVPNTLLAGLRLPPTQEPWIRVMGVVVAVLGAYYVVLGRAAVISFARATVWGRGLVLAGLVGLAATGLAPAIVVAFGVVDSAGALWTHLALRADAAGK